MALSYEEGMSALRAMFPSWDVQALAELLEANEGHLENTIDMVLTMEPITTSAAPANAAPSRQSSSASSAAAPAFAFADTSDDDDERFIGSVSTPAPSYRKSPTTSPRRKASSSASGGARGSRVTLPDDFLRLPVDESYGHHALSEQEQRDAVLAEMLQNEIFRQELLASEEFSAHFGGGGGARPSQTHLPDRTSFSSRGSAQAYPEKSAAEIATETFAAMSVKFATMSEAMKKKASEMYMRFQTRTDAPAQKDPYSHRPLMADDSSDEEDERRGGARQRHLDARGSPRSSATGPVRRANAGGKKDD